MKMDIKKRKCLELFGVFHVRSSAARMYMKMKECGRGLMSVKDVIRTGKTSLKDYVLRSEGWMFTVVANEVEEDEKRTEYVKRTERERPDQLTGGCTETYLQSSG